MIKLKSKDVEIYNITLLNSDEYKKYKSLIPLIEDDWWWLRDVHPKYIHNVCCVNRGGDVYDGNCNGTSGVRPFCTLGILNPIDITIGDKVEFGGYKWTVLDIEGNEIKILCDILVDNGNYHQFDDNTNIWNKSELFDWLNTEFLPELVENSKEYI